MSEEEVVVLRIFDSETHARMAQQVLHEASVKAVVCKDDVGGMEPHLRLTGGAHLVVNRTDAERAQQVLKPWIFN